MHCVVDSDGGQLLSVRRDDPSLAGVTQVPDFSVSMEWAPEQRLIPACRYAFDEAVSARVDRVGTKPAIGGPADEEGTGPSGCNHELVGRGRCDALRAVVIPKAGGVDAGVGGWLERR
jgi:hypothetical protein